MTDHVCDNDGTASDRVGQWLGARRAAGQNLETDDAAMRTFSLPLAIDNNGIGDDAVSDVEKVVARVGGHMECREPGTLLAGAVRTGDLLITVPADRYDDLIEGIAADEMIRWTIGDTPGIEEHAPAALMQAVARAQAAADARFDAECEADRGRVSLDL